MGVIEKAEIPVRTAPAPADDLDRFRLRRFIEGLADSGEVERRDAPVDLAGIAEILDGNPRAVHFSAVGPERQELVGNVVSSRTRVARAFGVTPERLAAEIQRRLATRPQIVEVTRGEAPVQQVVETEAADLTMLPVHLQHGLDGAPYICFDRLRPRIKAGHMSWLAKAREKRKNSCRFGVHSENLGYVYFLY
jgi:hypothetical protein